MTNKKDINSIEDIRLMVDCFYDKVRMDEKLSTIFNDVIQDKWPEHLSKMYKFWQTVMLGQHTYFGSPFPPHLSLPVDKSHFDQWLMLFCETVDTHFEGEKAEKAKWQGQRMAEMFQIKIEYYKNNNSIPLV